MPPHIRPAIRARINNNTLRLGNINQPAMADPLATLDSPPRPPFLPAGRILEIADGIDGDRERTFYVVYVNPPEVTPNW